MSWKYDYEVMTKECGKCGDHWWRIIRWPRRRNLNKGKTTGKTIDEHFCFCMTVTGWNNSTTVRVPSLASLVWDEVSA